MTIRTLASIACVTLIVPVFTPVLSRGLQSSGVTQAGAARPATATAPRQTPDAYRLVIDRYCVSCHSARTKTAGIVLEGVDLAHIGGSAEMWERVVWKLRSGSMPPLDRPRPDRQTYEGFASSLERELDRVARLSPNPGRTPAMHRLNRAEYRTVVRDLLDLDLDVTGLLPSDSGSYGFDNIAGVLSLSPALMERYLSAAERISAVAVGRSVPPTSEWFRVAGDLLQDDRMPELPFGTRGGSSFRYTFPQDGEYEFRMRLGRNQTDDIAGLAEASDLEVSIDGERVQVFTVGGRRRGPVATTVDGDPDASPRQVAAPRPVAPVAVIVPDPALPGPKAARGDFVPPRASSPNAPPPPEAADAPLHFRTAIKAGPRTVTVTFVRRTGAYAETTVNPYMRVESGQGGESRYHPYLTSVTLSGPFNPTGPGSTPSRDRIFACRPAAGADGDTCARQILSSLGRRAYRRPLTQADIQALMSFYQEGRAEGGFECGVELALRRILVDPEFLFRVEHDPAGVAPNTPYRLTDLELASRLSFFLWSSGPDDQLLDAAIRGRLRTPAVLQQQVRRMLADPRAQAIVSNFGGQWLYLRNVPSLVPNPMLFPDFDESLRQAMRGETELFFESIIREDRSAVDLLGADYTFVNERLARHYGIQGVYGADFRRVTVTDPNRGGLLGQASILAATSEPTRTSPVRRGKWVLENLLGAPPPPPPADVPALKENTVGSTKVLSMRAQMEEHRKNPACASCHKLMDPIGLALENFDALGRWRTRDPWMLTVEDEKWRPNEADQPIDGNGSLPDGTTFVGPAGLKRALLANPQPFVTTLTEKLMIYALGRGIESSDRPAIRAIVRDAATNRWRFSSLILEIVNSVPFQMRMSQPAAPVATDARR